MDTSQSVEVGRCPSRLQPLGDFLDQIGIFALAHLSLGRATSLRASCFRRSRGARPGRGSSVWRQSQSS